MSPSPSPRPDGPARPALWVRRAAVADLPAVLQMKAASWREAYGHLRPESFFQAAEASRDAQLKHWQKSLKNGTELWLAEDELERCVGMAAAGPARPDHAAQHSDLPGEELMAIYVLAEAQGTGVADELMHRVLQDRPAFLRVLADNPRARAFYRRHGFQDRGEPLEMGGPWAGLQEQLMVRPSPHDGAAGPA